LTNNILPDEKKTGMWGKLRNIFYHNLGWGREVGWQRERGGEREDKTEENDRRKALRTKFGKNPYV
jgi:hypothetical protein